MRRSERHVNKWPGADLGSHGESPALLCEASVSSLTRPLNMVHRWLIKPYCVRQLQCPLIIQHTAMTNTVTCTGVVNAND